MATPFPVFSRTTLLGGFAALGILAVAAGGYGTRGGAAPPPPGVLVADRTLLFADGADGSVVVTDARNGVPVAALTGENGFIRGTLRGLARTRRSENIGSADPFRLAAWSDGRLTLDDPATGQRIELEAFGSVNAAAFAKLLFAQGSAP